MKAFSTLTVILFSYSSWLGQICLGQEPQIEPPKTAIIHVRVNTAYDDSADSLTLLETLGKYAPVRVITVAPGDTLDALFVREYGFGKSDLPQSYALLLKIILEKNHLSRPEDLRAGRLIIPAVPKRAWMDFSRHNLTNYVANMSVFQDAESGMASNSANRKPARKPLSPAESNPPDLAFGKLISSDAHRFTAPFELLAFPMPVGLAGKLIESNAFAPGTVGAGTFPMPVKLAADENCDNEPASRDHLTLSAAQKQRIALILKEQTQRSVVLFILDTGWPSVSAYQESRDTLYAILDTVWRGKFGVAFPKSKALKTIPPAHHQHCRCIERSLREIRALQDGVDSSRRIKIIYIPLTQEQGASTMLADLLQTSNLLQRLEAENVSLNETIIRGARTWANGLVKSYFPRQWSGDEVETDKSALDAVLLIGQSYAKLSDTVFFASESWTVEHGGKYYVQYQTPEYGIVASAAGNDGTTHLLDFAQRSTNTNDTLAVINMTAAGVAPGSTRIGERDIDIALAAGFDGSVTDDVSGTSFSSPRIAWFLAAGESVRRKNLDLEHWGNDLRAQLKALRDSNATSYQKLLFDPVRYIEAQAQVQNGMSESVH
jgi:hypothetical protein